MTEEQILDHHCKKISDAIRLYIDRNDLYNFCDMMVDIRAEVQDAMQKSKETQP